MGSSPTDEGEVPRGSYSRPLPTRRANIAPFVAVAAKGAFCTFARRALTFSGFETRERRNNYDEQHCHERREPHERAHLETRTVDQYSAAGHDGSAGRPRHRPVPLRIHQPVEYPHRLRLRAHRRRRYAPRPLQGSRHRRRRRHHRRPAGTHRRVLPAPDRHGGPPRHPVRHHAEVCAGVPRKGH